jgi:hypothetical protein
VSEEARRTLRYVEPLSDTRTPLEDFFSILLGGFVESGEARPGRSGFRAGGIETDHIFIQLLRVGQVHLALFELGGL